MSQELGEGFYFLKVVFVFYPLSGSNTSDVLVSKEFISYPCLSSRVMLPGSLRASVLG